MPPEDPWLWIITVFLLVVGAYFSIVETSVSSSSRIRLKVKAEDGNRRAIQALKALNNYEKTVILSSTGYNIITVIISVMVTLLFRRRLENENLSTTLATLTVTALTYFFCDTLPKAYARHNPERSLVFVALFIPFFNILLYPLLILLKAIENFISSFIKKPKEPEFTSDELETILESEEEKGHLLKEETELIQSAIDFVDTSVKDVFTPLNKMIGINIEGLTKEELHEKLLKTKYSRLPIYRKTLNNIIGVVHIRSYFYQLKLNPKTQLNEVMVKPYFVNTKITINHLFEGFKKHKTHLAIVVDHNSQVVGMVTMEDVLEEIVGKMEEGELQLEGKNVR